MLIGSYFAFVLFCEYITVTVNIFKCLRHFCWHG